MADEKKAISNDEILSEIKAIFKTNDVTILTKDEIDTLRSMIKIYNALRGVGMVGTWLRTVGITLAAILALWQLFRTIMQSPKP